MAAATPSPAIGLNLELNPIPGQEAWVVLDLEGQVISSSSSNSGDPLQHDVPILFQMLQEAAGLTKKQQSMSRMTVSFLNNRYVIARDAAHIYVVQAKNTAI